MTEVFGDLSLGGFAPGGIDQGHVDVLRGEPGGIDQGHVDVLRGEPGEEPGEER